MNLDTKGVQTSNPRHWRLGRGGGEHRPDRDEQSTVILRQTTRTCLSTTSGSGQTWSYHNMAAKNANAHLAAQTCSTVISNTIYYIYNATATGDVPGL